MSVFRGSKTKDSKSGWIFGNRSQKSNSSNIPKTPSAQPAPRQAFAPISQNPMVPRHMSLVQSLKSKPEPSVSSKAHAECEHSPSRVSNSVGSVGTDTSTPHASNLHRPLPTPQQNNPSRPVKCMTQSPFTEGSLLWDISWDAVEIAGESNVDESLRSTPFEVGGHVWFVELNPNFSTQGQSFPTLPPRSASLSNTSPLEDPSFLQRLSFPLPQEDLAEVSAPQPAGPVQSQSISSMSRSMSMTPVMEHNFDLTDSRSQHCRFRVFIKSNRTPVRAKFSVFFTKNDEDWNVLHQTKIITFQHTGSEWDSLVRYSALSRLRNEDNILSLKVQIRVFQDVVTNMVSVCDTRDTLPPIPSQLKNNLGFLFRTGTFADVILVVNGEHIATHSCILATFSSRFAEMLKEKRDNTENNDPAATSLFLKISQPATTECVRGLVSYMYTEEVPLDIDLFELISLADYYRVERLVVVCLHQCQSVVSDLGENALSMLLWTGKYAHVENILKIEEKCLENLVGNLQEIMESRTYEVFSHKYPEIIGKMMAFIAKHR